MLRRTVLLAAGAFLVMAGVFAVSGSSVARADDHEKKPAADKSSADKPTVSSPADTAQRPRRLRLVKPYADMNTLSEDQKQKIMEIHADFLDRMREINEQREMAIDAVLTDDNRAEIKQIEDARRQATKERAAARRAERAATRPSDDEGR